MLDLITYTETQLTKRHRGTMPIILTAPHGGSEQPSRVSERSATATPAGCNFNTSRDPRSAEIAEAVGKRILELTGLSPYIVIAQFHRKFIDANRPQNCAFTDADAQPFYQEYHNRISTYVAQVLRENNNAGFLFDIHGTGRDTADIFLGTANGGTLPTFDRNRLFMRHGLHGLLSVVRRVDVDVDPVDPNPVTILPNVTTFRYRVSPPDSATTELDALNGGFTVRNYSSLPNPINCIQIELTSSIRGNPRHRAFVIEDLAYSLINFVRRYAPF